MIGLPFSTQPPGATRMSAITPSMGAVASIGSAAVTSAGANADIGTGMNAANSASTAAAKASRERET